MLYAVVLAGVPGRIINTVMARLRDKFGDNYVFRGAGAPLSRNSLADYTQENVDVAVRLAANAVFQKTSRPQGFCRKLGRPCARLHRKDNCEATEEHTCALKKPDNLVLIYQEGAGEQRLLDRFHHAALAFKIGRESYDRLERTVFEIVAALEKAKDVTALLSNCFRSSNCSVLLPPTNFDHKALTKLLKRSSSISVPDIASFRKAFFSRKSRAFENRSLYFALAQGGARHGTASTYQDSAVALTRTYRLGVSYPPELHIDVMRADGNDFDGSTRFFSRMDGKSYFPKRGRHVNCTVDDCLI